MRTKNTAILGAVTLLSLQAFGQSSLNTQPGDSRVAPATESEGKKPLPGDQGFSDLDLQIKRSQDALKGTLNSATVVEPPKQAVHASETSEPTPQVSTPAPSPVAAPAASRPRPKSVQLGSTPLPAEVFLPHNGTTVFNQNLKADWAEETVTLPGLSAAFGTVLFGEEVAATDHEWVAARLDYAFLGANGTVMELNGCRVDIEIKPNFNSSKVKGELKKIFCRSKAGRIFSQELNGKMISAASEYGGVESKIIMAGPARGIALEALQTTIKGYGAAVAAAQVTEGAASSQYNTFSTKNVTGDKDKYVVGKTLEANGEFLQYAIDFYKGLSPTLAVPPGAKVQLMTRDNIEIPREFFTQKFNIEHLEKDLKGTP